MWQENISLICTVVGFCFSEHVILLCSNLVTSFFYVIKPTRCTNFSNLFWHETLHVSGSSSVQLRSILVLLESCLQICMTYKIAECTVNKLLMTDRRTARNM